MKKFWSRFAIVAVIMLTLASALAAGAAQDHQGNDRGQVAVNAVQTIQGDIHGPTASTCGPWNEFNFGDASTPIVGGYSVSHITNNTNGTQSFDITMWGNGLSPGVVTASTSEHIIAHGFSFTCTPEIPIGTVLINKHGRLRDSANLHVTWTPQVYHSPQVGFCTGINTCFRTGPIALPF